MITFDELRAANEARQLKWEAGKDLFDLAYLGNAMAGECGEACNVIKKLERERKGAVGRRATPQELAEELADVVIYVDLIARRINVNLGQAVRDKFNKTSKGYDLGITL